jgi:hypothetical protein
MGADSRDRAYTLGAVLDHASGRRRYRR